jgi:hypothetical protein
MGVYARVGETEAETKVKTGYWAYAPKTEYKAWVKGITVDELQSTDKLKKEKKNKTKKS